MSPAAAQLAAMLSSAERIVAFTGAGISTESGIPDFRSPGGLWSQIKPITYQEFIGDEGVRRRSWERTFSGTARWTGSQPNDGHRALARLMAAGKLAAIITQNIDNLHQDAGADVGRVIELHGNASYAACLQCGLRHELLDLRLDYDETGAVPACRACGGIVKTAVISFGQSMPPGVMERARAETLAADLFLVLGSSLTVYPAAHLPPLAAQAGIPLVIVNRDPTPQDAIADLVLHEQIGLLLREAVDAAI